MSIGPAIAILILSTLPSTNTQSIGPAVAISNQTHMNSHILRIEKTQGYTLNYVGVRTKCDVYSVIYNGKIVIRTSNRTTAEHYYALYSEQE